MAKYFSNFPKTFYTFGGSGSGLDVVTNIISRFAVDDKLKNNVSVYYRYLIQDGDTPENLAAKYYNSSERHWIILMMNDIIDPQFDWPLQYQTLMEFIDKKYNTTETPGSGITWAKSNIHSYYKVITETNTLNQTIKKFEVDLNTYNDDEWMQTGQQFNYALADGTTTRISYSKETKKYYDYELEENENKRNIILLKKDFVEPLERELEKVFKQ